MKIDRSKVAQLARALTLNPCFGVGWARSRNTENPVAILLTLEHERGQYLRLAGWCLFGMSIAIATTYLLGTHINWQPVVMGLEQSAMDPFALSVIVGVIVATGLYIAGMLFSAKAFDVQTRLSTLNPFVTALESFVNELIGSEHVGDKVILEFLKPDRAKELKLQVEAHLIGLAIDLLIIEERVAHENSTVHMNEDRRNADHLREHLYSLFALCESLGITRAANPRYLFIAAERKIKEAAEPGTSIS